MDKKEEFINNVRENGTILFHYYRGSYAYGTYIDGVSDKDEGVIYICNEENILGLRTLYKEQISDDKHDMVAYEFGRFFELLLKNNPNVLEALFVPERCILYEHPLFHQVRKHRKEFLSKECIRTLLAFSRSQVEKARGLNKKIVNPITERKTPIDFCYTFNDKQGTKPITKWLEERGLKQKYVGMNHMPNMNQMYGCFYDWGQHVHNEFKTNGEFLDFLEYIHVCGENVSDKDNKFFDMLMDILDKEYRGVKLGDVYDALKPKGYHGIVKEDGTSNDVHLDSIVKGDAPICYMSYNEDGYQSHCRQYREYKEWEEKRNPIRYESNLNKNYDSKNMCHNIRLLTMAKELAMGGGYNIDRAERGDADFLLKIRNHEFEYDEILEMSDKLKCKIEENLKTCDLPDCVSVKRVNKILIDIRKKFYMTPLSCAIANCRKRIPSFLDS